MKKDFLIKHYKDLSNKYSKDSLFLKLQKKMTPFLQSLELKDKDIILAVSGGADSMIVANQILYYFHINELDLNKIHIAHCNHKIRPESEDEAKFMSEFFSGLDFHLFERKDLGNDDENSLRNRRYSQFSSLQKSTKSALVFLGHHLNDRVESTFLNLMRGAGIRGFLNMREVESHHLLSNECKVCRPLLNVSKNDILDICRTTGIPYFEDKTNLDNSVSKRNYIRNQIINPLSKDSKFLESFSNIYTQIENFENKGNVKLSNIPSFPTWNVEYSYAWRNNILNCDENDLFELFKYLKIQVSSKLIIEWKEWLNRGENGYKYISGTYFFIHEKQVYIIKAHKDFREKKIANEPTTVTSRNSIEYYGFMLDIPRDELIGSKIRLPEKGDIFLGKKWSRRALNQKIPMRWRDWIPLAIKNGKVIHIWKNIWK